MTDTASSELAILEQRRMVPWTPRFALTVDEAVELVDKKREFMKRVMRENEHFGTIPGTPKPTLYKPGAELLLSAMGLHSDSSINTSPPVIDLIGADHGGEAFVMFQKTCEIYREEIAGERILIARASANCSSWEKKYRYRTSDRECPTCGKKGTVIRGKEEYGGGWLCFKKKGGCGAKFLFSDKRITDQPAGEVPNPEIADLVNTIEKMASKRALVAATLLATGCSDIFTQDLEDGNGGSDDERPPVVDEHGEIQTRNASPETVSALQEAERLAAAPSPAAESNSGAVATAGIAVAAPPVASLVRPAPTTEPTSTAPVERQNRPTGPRAKRGNVVQAPMAPAAVPDDGQAAYMATLRAQASQAAAQLHLLNVRRKNKKAAVAGQAQAPEPPAGPNPASERSLREYVTAAQKELKLNAPTFEELDEQSLSAVITALEVYIAQLRK